MAPDQLHVAKLFRGDRGDQMVEGLELGFRAVIEALEHVVPSVDISPSFPPISSRRAAAALGSAFLGGGSSVWSLSTRMNILRFLGRRQVAGAATPVTHEIGKWFGRLHCSRFCHVWGKNNRCQFANARLLPMFPKENRSDKHQRCWLGAFQDGTHPTYHLPDKLRFCSGSRMIC